VTDASTHSSKDTLVTIVYNHEKDVCGLAPSQVVSRSKGVSPLDFDLAEDVQALAATRKIERLAAYRFLVALSNQVSEVTQRRQQLSSYFSPEAMHLKQCTCHLQGQIKRGFRAGAALSSRMWRPMNLS